MAASDFSASFVMAQYLREHPARSPDWVAYRLRALYGSTPRLDFSLPAGRRLRVEGLAHLDLADLMLDDQLDRQTLLAQHARDRLSVDPFYARRAAAARAEGREFEYWSEHEPGLVGRPRKQWSGSPSAERVALARATMEGRALVLPPIEVVVTEYGCRFTKQTDTVVAIARRKGRSAELCGLLLSAIESGLEVDLPALATRMQGEPAKPGTAAAWIEKRGPVTDTQRAATRQAVEQRIRNATPEQRAAFAAFCATAHRHHVGRIAHRATRAVVSGDDRGAAGVPGQGAGPGG